MNNKTKGLLLGLLAVALIGVFIWLKVSADNNIQNEEKSSYDQYSELSPIKDYETFLTLTNIVNDFYVKFSYLDSNYLTSIYSNEYLANNGLNSSNIVEKTNPNADKVNKYIQDNYYTCNNDNCFAFLELGGYNTDNLGENITPSGTEYLLITIDLQNKSYNFTPLTDITNLYDYANNYSKSKINIVLNDNNSFDIIEFDEKLLLKYYLYYIKYLIIINSDKINNYVTNYDSNMRITYLNTLSNTLYSFRKEEYDSVVKYMVILYDGTTMDLLDYSPMNFKITL